MSERSTSQVVGATLVGGMLGAGVALLFAPRSGKETRDKIHEGVNDMKQQASEKFDRLHSKVRQTGRKAKGEMQELKSKASRTRKQSPVLSAWEEEV